MDQGNGEAFLEASHIGREEMKRAVFVEEKSLVVVHVSPKEVQAGEEEVPV